MFQEILENHIKDNIFDANLIDSDFVEHMGLFDISGEKHQSIFWDKMVSIYEERKLGVGKHIFYALKKLNWLEDDVKYGQYNLEWLFGQSKKLAQYKEDIEKYLMLV